MFHFRRWLAARVIDILMEIRFMRASTQHLSDAVSALATSVANGNAQINTELEALLAAKADGDDALIEAQAQKIRDITASTDEAVKAAQASLTVIPPDQPAPAPQG